MLSHDVEMMQGKQRCVPSFIRFQTFDDCALDVGKPLYKFRSPIFSSRKICIAGGNREIRIFGFTYAVTSSKSCEENIEATADCINIDTRLDVERERERRFHLYYNWAVRQLRFKLFDLAIDVGAEPGFDFFPEGWQLGYGPINACVGM